jgi:hypothetical protein
MFDNTDEKNKKGYITLSDLQSILYSAFSMKPEEVEKIFKEINIKNDNQITYGKKSNLICFEFSILLLNKFFICLKDELKNYADSKPELARIFTYMLNEIKLLNSNTELDRLASQESSLKSDDTLNTVSSTNNLIGPVTPPTSEITVMKRPLSDKSSAIKESSQKDLKLKNDIVIEDVADAYNQKNE